MIDCDELAVRSLDEPLEPDERAALRVWADALEAAGDPRGPLITMEHALRDQPARRHELHLAMNEHVTAHAPELLGELAPHLRVKRALALDWRSGILYGPSRRRGDDAHRSIVLVLVLVLGVTWRKAVQPSE